jgi:hypothetical protein
MNVQLGGGGDEVVVLASLELQGVRHWGEGPEGDREESENNIINIGKILRKAANNIDGRSFFNACCVKIYSRNAFIAF